MKKHYILLFIVSLLCEKMILAQAPLIFDNMNIHEMQGEDQLPSSTIQTIYQYYLDHQDLTPSESELRDMPRNSSIPSNMEEIYFDHVWLNIAEYCWLEGDHYSTAVGQSVGLNIPDRKQGNLFMLFDNLKDDSRHVIDARAMRGFDHEPLMVTKVKNNFYLTEKSKQNKSDGDYQLIVDYRDGVMFYENTFSGKPGDFTTFRRFRYAALGIPKSLLEETNASNMPVISSTLELLQFDTKGGGWKPHVKRTNSPSKPVYQSKPAYQSKLPVYVEEELEEVEEINRPQVAVCAKPAAIGDMLSQEDLMALRPGQRIASGLNEELYKSDWLELGGLMWYQGESYWGNSSEAPLYRFSRDGGVSEYEVKLADAGKKSPKFINTLSNDVFNLTKRGNFVFISNGEEGNDRIEYTVLSYDGNILVLDEFDGISGIRVRKVLKATARVR